MRKLVIALIFAVLPYTGIANDDTSYNLVSDAYNDEINDLQIIRPMRSGSVILADFDASCPDELKGAFMFACKIMEEAMPISLPITVYVSLHLFRYDI